VHVGGVLAQPCHRAFAALAIARPDEHRHAEVGELARRLVSDSLVRSRNEDCLFHARSLRAARGGGLGVLAAAKNAQADAARPAMLDA